MLYASALTNRNSFQINFKIKLKTFISDNNFLTMSSTEATGKKKKRDGNRMMDFERQQRYRDKLKEASKEEKLKEDKKKKKSKDRLRYLLKKEEKSILSNKEKREKRCLERKK